MNHKYFKYHVPLGWRFLRVDEQNNAQYYTYTKHWAETNYSWYNQYELIPMTKDEVFLLLL